MNTAMDNEQAVLESVREFERQVGITSIPIKRVQVGNREFLKFKVGREAPLYTYALLESQKNLSEGNPYRGAMALLISNPETFPSSIEASSLITLLSRSTREVSEGSASRGYHVPYVPFQKQEDHHFAQPASHIVRGRRGVGKSTLIRRATQLLSNTKALVAVLDMQSYSLLTGNDLMREVMYDTCVSLSKSSKDVAQNYGLTLDANELDVIADDIISNKLALERAPVRIKRALSKFTGITNDHAFIFLDDFHLVDYESQPALLHFLHAAIKGANGWLKVAGLSSLLNVYSATTRQGLQVPGDAQFISLDLTLENPEAAENHLKIILGGFLEAVGYQLSGAVIPESAFRRLAWATAGVPRDFLQMFARSLEHASRNRHNSITLSDVNVAIGEFGQQKLNEVEQDARNEAGELRAMLSELEKLCLEDNNVNAFLIRSEDSKERRLVQILSDLRMVHLINQSITPERAGQRFEAFILDYSLFTGFRRRPGIAEMIPAEYQFKAAELRALPKVSSGFLARQSNQ